MNKAVQFIDTHAHISDSDYELEDLIARSKDAGVIGIVDIATSSTSIKKSLEFRSKYSSSDLRIWTAGAITPSDAAQDLELDIIDALEENISLIDIIGETGLDCRFYEDGGFEKQACLFRKHLNLAKQHSKPVMVHCYRAFKDVGAIIDEVKMDKDGAGVCHCFVGSLDDAKEFLNRGWLISLSGILTFKNAKDLAEVVKAIPLNRIVIETDAPALAPVPLRGKVNEPAFAINTLNFLSELLEKDIVEVAHTLLSNSYFLLNRNVN